MKGRPMDWDAEVDCAGLLCPLPVLRARKRLLAMAEGQVLRVIATDKMAAIDLPHFCAESGHRFLLASHEAGCDVYLIQRGKS
jgi:tRNA 2-thiouridine synthesizing protein A